MHTIEDRKSLWGKRKSINLRQQGPWLSMGYYNAIHRAEDKLIGSTVHEAETKDFDSFFKDTRMAILRANGREFTWNNGHTYSRNDWEEDRRHRPFKFLNHLAQHGEFQRTVQMAWQQSHNTGTMYGVWQKLKMVKITLKELNIAEYQRVETRIRMYRQQLYDLQSTMRQPGQSTDILQLENEVKLLGSCATQLPAANPMVMRDGPILDRNQQAQLIKHVTRQKVVIALQGINDAKAPGCDVFNALFFKNTWENIGEEIIGNSSPQREARGWDEEVLWANTYCKGKQARAKVYRMAVEISVYVVWQERNQHIFKKIIRTPGMLVRKIVQEVHLQGRKWAS
ncbi:hypothetical protein MTR67_048985 [Solanum verrucosum]|uniref:Uncharacterized protein n=1 Tax=Solanum verrucosum TaxID=315347 RepID=A0AAF0UZE8_SOLVR|nr:hypothetical protein MTR67_048985 [Solanum verrucosum]